MHSTQNNVGAELKAFFCGAARLVAAGTGDNTKITGASIDRLPAGAASFSSGKLIVAGSATLAQDATAKLALEYQDSDDNSNWNTAVVIEATTTVGTGGSGGSTENLLHTFDVNLAPMRRYVRFNVTPDLSAGSVDIAQVAAVFIAGGPNMLPVTNAIASV